MRFTRCDVGFTLTRDDFFFYLLFACSMVYLLETFFYNLIYSDIYVRGGERARRSNEMLV